ncbi:MAG: hypothetical protein ACYDA9_18370 [Terriglobia bacterium]
MNIESSFVVKLRDSSPLFYEAAEYLQKIKNVCEEFDLSRIEFYKELQRNIDERTVPVIEVEARAAGTLGGSEISIFGTHDEDLKELGTVRRKVYLSATETDSAEEEFVYPAKITQVGELNSSNPLAGKVAFSPRRYAYRAGRKFAALLPAGDISPDVLKNSKYYVTLELNVQDENVSFDYPRTRTAAWEVTDEGQSPLIRRLDGSAMSSLFRSKEPRVKHPVRIEQESQALTLYERRNAPERRLLTKRVVVPKK